MAGGPVGRALGDDVLVVSGFGDDGRGGLFTYDGEELATVDTLTTTGIACRGDRVGRLLRAGPASTSTAELLVTDTTGVLEYRRLDAVADPHDLVAQGDGWLVVSTTANAVRRLHADGTLTTVWSPTDVTDAWHVNCLEVDGASLWVSAFGRFEREREWSTAGRGTGFLVDLLSGRSLEGLTHPHSPRLVDGEWWLCESLDGLVSRFDATSLARRGTVQLQGYTRGLAVLDDLVFTGESVSRHEHGGGSATVAVSTRSSGAVLERISLPCLEVYDVRLVPRSLVGGLVRGFDTNLQRVAERGGAAMWDAVGVHDPALGRLGMPLPASRCRVDVVADDLPAAMRIGESVTVPVSVTNRGGAPLATVPPYPVAVSSRWLDLDGRQVDGPRSPLDGVLEPAAQVVVALPVHAPDRPGTYTLAVSLVQEQVAWFDDLDGDSGLRLTVSVTP